MCQVVPSGRKAGAGALASAAKEAAKEIVRAAEDGASALARQGDGCSPWSWGVQE